MSKRGSPSSTDRPVRSEVRRRGDADHPCVLLTNFHLGRGGGHDTVFRNILRSDLRSLFAIHVASTDRSRLARLTRRHRAAHHPCHLQINPRRPVRLVRSVARFAEIVRTVEPDLVHTNAGHDAWIATLARPVSGRDYALVRTHHTSEPIEATLANRWLYDRAVDVNVFVTRSQLEEATADSYLRPRRWEIVPNGIDLDRYRPRSPDPALYEELRLEPNDFVLGSVAGSAVHKRVDLALRAVSSPEVSPRVKVCVLGKESTAGPLREEARRLGVEDRFVHAGFHGDVRPYVALFDLGFVLSDLESCSLATREMMAMGVPVISSDFAASRENIDEGRDGFIVPAGSPEAVRAVLARVRAMRPGEREDLSRRARAKAVDRFGASDQIRALARLWNQVLRRRGIVPRQEP